MEGDIMAMTISHPAHPFNPTKVMQRNTTLIAGKHNGDIDSVPRQPSNLEYAIVSLVVILYITVVVLAIKHEFKDY